MHIFGITTYGIYKKSRSVLVQLQKIKMKKKFDVVSLFSGCGGFDLGFTGNFKFLKQNFSKTNFNIIWSNDIDRSSCETYKKNLNGHIICQDIKEILDNKSSKIFHNFPKKADVILGGFPCQDFSLAGKRKGFKKSRGLLYTFMVRSVELLRPKVFVAENVKGLLSINNGYAIKKIIKDFSGLGYDVKYKLFKVSDYGVPSIRERVLIFGKKSNIKSNFEFPPPQKNNLTLYKILYDLENKEEGYLENHYWSKAKFFKNTQGNTYVKKDSFGPTIRAEHHGNIEWHWNKKRRLSAREVARIQTFPDNFIFYPSTSSAYKQIGNAVPPVFIWHFAKKLEKFLSTI